jgi:hypothetical protein
MPALAGSRLSVLCVYFPISSNLVASAVAGPDLSCRARRCRAEEIAPQKSRRRNRAEEITVAARRGFARSGKTRIADPVAADQ